MGALLDANFDHMITTRLIKLVYVLAIVLVSSNSLVVASIGVWVAQLRNGWFLGLLIILFAPVIWLFQLVITRIFMEFMINQFKITEHLKAIREREGLR
jgi:membrane protein YdbS with pleckstrin-like domain